MSCEDSDSDSEFVDCQSEIPETTPAPPAVEVTKTADPVAQLSTEIEALEISELEASDTSELNALDTSELNASDTSENETPNTSENGQPNTSEHKALDTSEHEAPETSDHEAPDTSEHEASDTSENEAPNTSENEALDTSENEASKTSPVVVPYSEDELVEIEERVTILKNEGNMLYKSGEEYAAMEQYTQGITLCREQLNDLRSVLLANRAACHLKKLEYPEAEEDCSASIDLQPAYVKAILRRAQVREHLDKLSPALEDYKRALELQPGAALARDAIPRLSRQIEIQQEKMKEECISKLKDLGNLVLKPFGMSTDNFKMVQDPNTGGYNIQFSQDK